MGFQDRDYVREKARRVRAEIDAQYAVNRNPWLEDEWKTADERAFGAGGSNDASSGVSTDGVGVVDVIREIVRWAIKLVLFGIGLSLLLWSFGSEGPFHKVSDSVVSAVRDVFSAPDISHHSILSADLIPTKPTLLPSKTGYTRAQRQVVMKENVSYRIVNAGGTAIFARFYARLSDGSESMVREFYVLSGDTMHLHRLDKGVYVMRYKRLDRDSGHFTSKPMLVGLHGERVYSGVELKNAVDPLRANRQISRQAFDR